MLSAGSINHDIETPSAFKTTIKDAAKNVEMISNNQAQLASLINHFQPTVLFSHKKKSKLSLKLLTYANASSLLTIIILGKQ